MDARNPVAELKALLKKCLEESPYYRTDEQGDRQLYFSFSNSRDFTLQRLFSIKATTVEDFLSILTIEYHAITMDKTFLGTLFQCNNKDSVVAKALRTCIKAASKYLSLRIPNLNTSSSDKPPKPLSSKDLDELLSNRLAKPKFGGYANPNARRNLAKCSEKLLEYISKTETSFGYKVERLFDLNLHFNRFHLAEQLANDLRQFHLWNEAFEHIEVMQEKLSQLSNDPEEMHSELIAVIDVIKDEITKQFLPECCEIYDHNFLQNDYPNKIGIQKPASQLINYLKDFELHLAHSQTWLHDEPIELLYLARHLLHLLLKCNSDDALKPYANKLFSIWFHLNQDHPTSPLIIIINAIRKCAGETKIQSCAEELIDYLYQCESKPTPIKFQGETLKLQNTAGELLQLLLQCNCDDDLKSYANQMFSIQFQLHQKYPNSPLVLIINKIRKCAGTTNIQKYGKQLIHFLQKYKVNSSQSQDEPMEILVARQVLRMMLKCKTDEDLQPFGDQIFSMWFSFYQKHPDSPLIKIIQDIGELAGTKNANLSNPHPPNPSVRKHR